MMPPPTAANIPNFRPVRAMAGVPRQVATNKAVAIGTWLLLFSGLFCVSVVVKLSVLSTDCWVGRWRSLDNLGFNWESIVDVLDRREMLGEFSKPGSEKLEVDGKLLKPTEAFLCACGSRWQELISQILISQELLSRALGFEQSLTAGLPRASRWAWDLARCNETKYVRG